MESCARLGLHDAAEPKDWNKGYKLKKRLYYVNDAVFELVHGCASLPLQDVLDLAYLTGQRPADVLSLSEHDIANGHLTVTQDKTGAPLRIRI